MKYLIVLSFTTCLTHWQENKEMHLFLSNLKVQHFNKLWQNVSIFFLNFTIYSLCPLQQNAPLLQSNCNFVKMTKNYNIWVQQVSLGQKWKKKCMFPIVLPKTVNVLCTFSFLFTMYVNTKVAMRNLFINRTRRYIYTLHKQFHR